MSKTDQIGQSLEEHYYFNMYTLYANSALYLKCIPYCA